MSTWTSSLPSQAFTRASWCSSEATWTVETVTDGGEGDSEGARYKCRFLWGCMGYYDYDKPYIPEFPGREEFAGEIVHPQLWDEGLDYAGKRIVVIGSGATAITLIPSMITLGNAGRWASTSCRSA